MKKVWKYSEEEIVINLAAALLGVEELPWPLQECMGSAATLFYAPPCPFCASYFRAAAGSSLGSGDACRSLRRACAHNAPCTGEPQKKFNELAASMLELAALVRGLAWRLHYSPLGLATTSTDDELRLENP